jgi:hypothetical protein
MKALALTMSILILLASFFQCCPFPKPQLPAVSLPGAHPTESATWSPVDAAISSPVPSPAPAVSETPTLAPELPSTPFATPLPEALSEQIEQTYTTLVLIQANAELLNESATRVQSGELDGLEGLGAVFAVAALIAAVDESIPQTMPPDPLRSAWNAATVVHQQTKDLAGRWLDKQVDSAQVVAEIEPLLTSIGEIVTEAEAVLGTEYGFDSDMLTREREDTIDSLPDVFQ